MTKEHNAYITLYRELIERGLFTRKELELITDLVGKNIDTLKDCLWSRYGVMSLEQL
jgi:hypothetical protein